MFSPDSLSDRSRLDAVAAVLPASPGPDDEFDRLTRLASRMLNVPTCLVSLVTSDRQEFRGACGLPENLTESRGTPLSHSICQITVTSGELVCIEDAMTDPRTFANPVIDAIGLRSYLGFPLMNDSGKILGAFCLIDYKPRQWTLDDLDAVRDFAALAVGQLDAVANNARIRAAFDVALHDLKTPLSGILMASSMFKEQMGLIPVQLHPLLEVVESSTAAAIRLVKALAEEDQRKSARWCEHPAATLSNVVGKLLSAANSKGMEIDVEFVDNHPVDVPPWVLEQMLENLTSNAIKYAPIDSRITLRFDVSGAHGHFYVRDQGPGFSMDDREKMFLRYSRLSASPTAGESSTGLGLSIVKRLAGQHGGTVELINPVDTGAEFRVSFPLRLRTA